MPSPLPGMDLYIETPELWSDFHNNLASEMQAQLNRLIQPRYFARLTPYMTYEVVEVGEAPVKLKNGREAHVTMHVLEGSKDEIEKQLKTSLEAFFDFYPDI